MKEKIQSMDFVRPYGYSVVIIGSTRLIAIIGIIFGAKLYIDTTLNGHFHTFLFHNY